MANNEIKTEVEGGVRNSVAMGRGEMSPAVAQALTNGLIKLAQAQKRAAEGKPISIMELHEGTPVIGRNVAKE